MGWGESVNSNFNESASRATYYFVSMGPVQSAAPHSRRYGVAAATLHHSITMLSSAVIRLVAEETG